VLIAAGAAAVMAAAAAHNVVRLRRARRALHLSLSRQGYAVVSARPCWLSSGPFGSAIALHQPVYRVVARDGAGTTRCGWVRCLPFSDQADVVWQ
jgi:hypothetical protein